MRCVNPVNALFCKMNCSLKSCMISKGHFFVEWSTMLKERNRGVIIRNAVSLQILQPYLKRQKPHKLVASTTLNWIPEPGCVDMHRAVPTPAIVSATTLKRGREQERVDTLPLKKQCGDEVVSPWSTYLTNIGHHEGYVGKWTQIQQLHEPAMKAIIRTPFEPLRPCQRSTPHDIGPVHKSPFSVKTTITGKKLVCTHAEEGCPDTGPPQFKNREDPHVVYGTRDIRSVTDTTEMLQEVALAIKTLHAEQRKNDRAQINKFLNKPTKHTHTLPKNDAMEDDDDEEDWDEEEDEAAVFYRKRPEGGEEASAAKQRHVFERGVNDENDPRKIENNIFTNQLKKFDSNVTTTQKKWAQSIIIPPLETGTVEHRIGTLDELKAAWAKFMQTLYSIPMARGFDSYFPQQELMLKSMCSSLAVAYFHSHYTDVLPWLQSTYDLHHAKFVVGVVASRQVGKTTLAAALMVSALVSFGKLQMGIASTGQRASINVLSVVKEFLRSLEIHKGGLYTKDTQQVMKIVLNNGSSITALPMSVDTNRGIPYDVVYVDEAAFIKVEMLSKVVVPLLVRPGRCLFMTSTPHTDPSNHFTKLLTADGGKLIDVVILSLVCNACSAMRGFDGACPHRQSLLSEDVKSSRARLTEAILKCISDEATVQTELQGRPSIETSAAFNPSAIKDLQDARAVFPEFTSEEAKPKYMFMCIDPTGGGPSDFAIICGYGVKVAGIEHPLTIVSRVEWDGMGWDGMGWDGMG